MIAPKKNLIVKKRGGGERVIKAGYWLLDQNTPVGEDADYYEIKPYNGRRWIPRNTIIRQEASDER